MRKVLVASVLALLLIGFFARGASAGEGAVWIYGDVLEVPTGVDYGGAYYQFNFSIGQTNSSLMTNLPRNITVVIPVVLMSILVFNNFTQTLGEGLNFTGEVVEDQPNLQSIPVGYFAVSQINGAQSEAPAWVQSLKTLWNAVSGIGKMVVTLIVQVIGSTAGFVVPEWVIALAVISFTLVVFAKWFKSLPWILVVIGFFVCAAILSSLIQGLMW